MVRARVFAIGLAGLVLMLAGSVSWAAIYTLTDDYTIQQIQTQMGNALPVYDKTFSNFSVTDTSKNGGNAPDESSISVAGVWIDANDNQTKDLADEFGLRFTGGWSAVNTDATGGRIADTVIRFKVTADQPYLIVDNTLWMSSAGAANGGLASITESVYDRDGPGEPIAVKYVYYADPGDYHVYDQADFPSGYSQVWIIKDVQVNAGSLIGGNAAISEFYQTFSQVPEPAAVALLCLGGLLLARRRH